LTVDTLAMGGHSLTAAYSGDVAFLPNTSASISQTIIKAQTAVTAAPAANPSQYGPIEFVFSVTPVAPGAGQTTGFVVVSEGDHSYPTAELDETGSATLQLQLPAGTHNLTVTYTGDTHFLPSSTTLTWEVLKANTQLGLTASRDTADTSTPVTLKAWLTNESGNRQVLDATGAVEFLDGTASLGTATFSSGGYASITRTLAEGSHDLTARYPGDSNYNASEAKAVPIFITPAGAPPSGGVDGEGIPADYPVGGVLYRTIASAGPLKYITVTAQLGCSVTHVDDQYAAFFDGVGGCATIAVVDGVPYGPAFLPGNSGVAPYTMVSQSSVRGKGTASQPFLITTTVDAGGKVRVTQTDSYVVGDPFYNTGVSVTNLTTNPTLVSLRRLGDCYVSDNDKGFGYADSEAGAVGCRAAEFDSSGAVPAVRTLVWRPTTTGDSYEETDTSATVGQFFASGGLADSCRCNDYVDNGAGVAWQVSLAGRASGSIGSVVGFEDQPLPVAPPTPVAGLRYVVLGDSVSYGHGLANPTKDPKDGLPANQGPSTAAWPSYVGHMAGLRPLKYRPTSCDLGGHSTVVYDQLAYSGAPADASKYTGKDTNCVYAKGVQVPVHKAVSPEETLAADFRNDPPALVSIQAGANDINFPKCLGSVLGEPTIFGTEQCAKRDGQGTLQLSSRVAEELASLRTALAHIIDLIHGAAPSAQIIVVNYYQIMPKADADLTGTSVICQDLRKAAKNSKFRRDAREIGEFLQSKLNAVINDVASSYTDVELVNIVNLFSGHEMCTIGSWLLDGAWNAAHPTADGQREIGHYVVAQCGLLPKKCIGR
jgi:hypothetical protein